MHSLSGLPSSFLNRTSAFATEFEIEYFVLGTVDDGLHEDGAIQEYVISNVRSLSTDDEEAVSEAIIRLIDKQILERDSDSLNLRLT